MTNSARPLTPPDCDVRDYPRMMVDVRVLLASEFNRKASAVPLAWMVGHKLWYSAFHETPAGSLPTADSDLAYMAQLGSDVRSFKRVRALALHGWSECSDGRLYHSTVAKVVLEVWIDKLLLKLKSGAGNARRHASKGFVFDPGPVVLSLETAGAYLALLDPEARGLEKIRRRSERDPVKELALLPAHERVAEIKRRANSYASVVQKRSECAPSALPVGGHLDSECAPSDLRVRSQAKAEAQVEEIDNTGLGAREPIDQARRAQIASLQAQLMGAGGEALADIAAAPALANLSPVLNLLEPGDGPACDLELDVLPVVRQRTARCRPRSIKSWNFFTDAIVEARDARLRGAPALSEASHDHSPGRPAGPFSPDTDTRGADTERRRNAWVRAAAERDGPGDRGEGDGGGGGSAGYDPAPRPRLAHAG